MVFKKGMSGPNSLEKRPLNCKTLLSGMDSRQSCFYYGSIGKLISYSSFFLLEWKTDGCSSAIEFQSILFICFKEEQYFFFKMENWVRSKLRRQLKRFELSDLESFLREKTSSHQHVMSRRETFWKPGERMFCIFKHLYYRKAI